MKKFFAVTLRVVFALGVALTGVCLAGTTIADSGTTGLQNVYSCTGPDTPPTSSIPTPAPGSIELVVVVPCAYQYLYTDMSQYDTATALCIQTVRANLATEPYGSLPDETAYNDWVNAGNTTCPESD